MDTLWGHRGLLQVGMGVWMSWCPDVWKEPLEQDSETQASVSVSK